MHDEDEVSVGDLPLLFSSLSSPVMTMGGALVTGKASRLVLARDSKLYP